MIEFGESGDVELPGDLAGAAVLGRVQEDDGRPLAAMLDARFDVVRADAVDRDVLAVGHVWFPLLFRGV